MEEKIAQVIGATGFVGSHVTKNLLKKGYHVKATTRDPSKAKWLEQLAENAPGKISLHKFVLTPEGDLIEQVILNQIAEGAKYIFMCAGYEKQEISTIGFMKNAALLSQITGQNVGAEAVIQTSSTGSTNLPDWPDKDPKTETHNWSDSDKQRDNKRFSPAAKTIMELFALDFVGLNKQFEVIDSQKHESAPRLCIINPSLVLAPQIEPGEVKGNSLPWVVRIVNGESMAEKIPNDSMSIIHCDDLAKLHIAAAENPKAEGRYFGLCKSWPWFEIMQSIKNAEPDFKVPPMFEEEPKTPTQFDFTRRDSLGVELMGLDDIVKQTLTYMREKGHVKI